LVEVTKRERESSEGLLRRFSRKVQQSGVLLKARKNRYKETAKNKARIRKDAIRRAQIQKERDHLKKLGKLKETRFGKSK